MDEPPDMPMNDQPITSVEDVANDSPPTFPLYVRILAVAHVLSLVVGPLVFFVLSGAACFHWMWRRQLDGWVVGLWLGGVGFVISCAAFRRWFERFGRRNWPDGIYRPREKRIGL